MYLLSLYWHKALFCVWNILNIDFNKLFKANTDESSSLPFSSHDNDPMCHFPVSVPQKETNTFIAIVYISYFNVFLHVPLQV